MTRAGRTAALVTALFIAVTASGDWSAMLRSAPVLMSPAIVAALSCWLLTRRLFGGDERNGGRSPVR